MEVYQPPQHMKMMMMELKTVTHQECHQPLPSFFLRVSGPCRCTSHGLPATLVTFRLSIKVRLLYQGGTTRPWNSPFLYIYLEPSHLLGSCIVQRG